MLGLADIKAQLAAQSIDPSPSSSESFGAFIQQETDKWARVVKAAGVKAPRVPDVKKLPSGDTILWRAGTHAAMLVHSEPPKSERKRHSRKYSEGNLGPERSFYFRGPEGKLNLKAHNLVLFLQIAEGVDDETWEFHRKSGDFSKWVRAQVKDNQLADELAEIEADSAATAPKDTRAAVRHA